MEKIEKELCPLCKTKNLTLTEEEKDIPEFGKIYILSMKCSNCNYSQLDIESETKKSSKYTIETKDNKDLKTKVIMSSNATFKIPQLKLSISQDSGIKTIEEILAKFKKDLEDERDNSDDDEARKKAKNSLKKLWKVECGDIPLKIILEDKTKNSGIISKKVKTGT